MLLREHANKIIEAALAAAMPDAAVCAALEKVEFADGRLVLIAAGKAGWQMAKAAHDQLGDRVDRGIVITKYDGYDPDYYDRMISDMTNGEYDAEDMIRTAGRTSRWSGRDYDGLNMMRRNLYEQNKDEINAQKRSAYAKRKERESSAAEEFIP